MALDVAQPNAFETLDDAFHLLRALPAAAWGAYLSGAVPFLLALLWTLTDPGAPFSAATRLQDSLLCAATFAALQVSRARFAEWLEAQQTRLPPTRWTVSRIARIASLQVLWQTLKLAVVPLTAAAVLPWAPAVAFFENITVLLSRPLPPREGLLRTALRLASFRQKQNWLVLLVFSAMAVFVFLNIGIALLILPSLVKALTGYENQFTRGLGSPLNWVVVQLAGGFTWLLTMPLLQAVAVQRIHQAESVETGADLLNALSRPLVALLLLICAGSTLHADTARGNVSPPVLAHNIEQALEQREYSWHRQELADAAGPPGFLRSLEQFAQRGLRAAGKAISRFFQWLDEVFRRQPANTPEPERPAAPTRLRWVMLALVCLLAAGLAIVLLRRRAAPEAVDAPPPLTPVDLESADTSAADLPEESWLQLAQQHAAQQEYRLAVRALYLAALAHLGNRQLLTLEAAKTNREYQRELRRRTANEALHAAFRAGVRRYESSWYGRHPAGPAEFAQLQEDLHALEAHAE